MVAGDVVEDRAVGLGHVHDHRGVIREVAVEQGVLPEDADPVSPSGGEQSRRVLVRHVGRRSSGEAAPFEGRDLFVESVRHVLRQNIDRLLRQDEGRVQIGIRTFQTLHFLQPARDPLIVVADGDGDRIASLIHDSDRDNVGRRIRIDRVLPEHQIFSADRLEVHDLVICPVAPTDLVTGHGLVQGQPRLELPDRLERADTLGFLREILIGTAAVEKQRENHNTTQQITQHVASVS